MNRLLPFSRPVFVFSCRTFFALVGLALVGPSLTARSGEQPGTSFGFFVEGEQLSELNAYIRTEGRVDQVQGGLIWPRFIHRLQELPHTLAFLPVFAEKDSTWSTAAIATLSAMKEGPNEAVARSEIIRLVHESHAQDPSIPLLLWAGMLREGVGVPRNPKEALAEFLRVAALEGSTDDDLGRKSFALREAVITRLLFAREAGDSQDLRDAVRDAVRNGLPGAYYWNALLQKFEKLTAKIEWISYGNIDGMFDGTRAGELLCLVAAANRQALQPAVEAGMPMAWYNLAILEQRGMDGPVNEGEARRLYGLAIDAGMPEAQCGMAFMLAEGRGGPVDLPGAMQRLRLAAVTDDNSAYILGLVLFTGEWGEHDPKEGMAQLAAAAKRGLWRAGLLRAWYLHLGLAAEPDDAAAKEGLLAAAQFAGHESNAAHVAIGLALWNGAVGPPARADATKAWLTVPADQLPSIAKLHLATAYRLGIGVSADLTKAADFAGNALKDGISVAALELAEVRLLQKKELEAIGYFRRAADGGSAVALSRLADCAAQGIGGPARPELAQRLREQARALSTQDTNAL